jgi:hypothetical protein
MVRNTIHVISVPYLQACYAGNGEDSNRIAPLGDNVSSDTMLIGDVTSHHHPGRGGGWCGKVIRNEPRAGIDHSRMC